MLDSVVDLLPEWSVSFLVWLLGILERIWEPLLVGTVAAAIAGYIVGRRSARHLEQAATHLEVASSLIRDQLVDAIQPEIEVKVHGDQNWDNATRKQYLVKVLHGSKPAVVLRGDFTLECDQHQKKVTVTKEVPPEVGPIAAGNAYTFEPIDVQMPECNRCSWKIRFNVLYSDQRKLRFYEQDERGKFSIVPQP